MLSNAFKLALHLLWPACRSYSEIFRAQLTAKFLLCSLACPPVIAALEQARRAGISPKHLPTRDLFPVCFLSLHVPSR